jgi:hypothetical protein
LKLKLIYDRQSVCQSVLVSGTHLGLTTNFPFSLKFPLDSSRFVILQCPLWREDWSVIYCTIASGPCQSSHSWVEVPQNSPPYFTVSSETPPTWRARSLYLYPPWTRWPSYTPRHWVPFSRLLRLTGTTVEVLYMSHVLCICNIYNNSIVATHGCCSDYIENIVPLVLVCHYSTMGLLATIMLERWLSGLRQNVISYLPYYKRCMYITSLSQIRSVH